MKPLTRWLTLGAALVVLNLLSFCSHLPPIHPPGVTIIYAQALPATIHALWAPNPGTDNVTQYQVKLDNGAAVAVLPTSCTATVCTSAGISVPSYGMHTVVLTACNLKIGTDPTTLQCSAPSPLPFTLNPLPGSVTGGTITN